MTAATTARFEPELPPDRDFDESTAFDGRGDANIFDVDDVYDPEFTELVTEELGEATHKEDDDGFAPDDTLGTGDPAGEVVRYNGGEWIVGIPTRADLVAANDKTGISPKLQQGLLDGKSTFFMPSDVEETNDYQGGYPVYALRLFGNLMDGSKAEVTITGIDVFFDVQMPDRPPASALLSKAGQKRLAGMEDSRVTAFDAHLRQIVSEAGVDSARFETVSAFPDRGYHVEPKTFKRIHTQNLQQRKKAIAAVRGAGYETKSDDRSSYYRKASREYGLPLSDWAVVSQYEYSPGYTAKSPLCAHLIRVPVESYKPFVDTMAPKEVRDAAAKVKAKTPLLVKDRSLVVTWDIETHSNRGTGDVPDAEKEGDEAFMICLTAHWKDDPTPLHQICIVDVDTAPDKRWTTVVCGTPQNVLKAFALCWRSLAPDINIGFNDSEYDWPFVVEKARKLGIIGWMWNTMSASPRRTTTNESVMKWNYNIKKKIKITAEEVFFSTYLKVPGCVPIDIRACYKKLFPKSETPKAGSLKFYLEVSGLDGKADMPVKRMWRYYEAALTVAKLGPSAKASLLPPDEAIEAEVLRRDAQDHFAAAQAAPDSAEAAEHMRHVGHYCVIDALRCQHLQVRRGVINDYREVSTLAFVSLFDSHYYAGGMKVCNLLGAYAWRRNILVSMIAAERAELGKYPGAHVFQPEKGIAPDPDRLAAVDAAAAELRAALADEASGVKNAERVAAAKVALAAAFHAMAGDRPVTGLDFSSLYPSLIMAYNFSPEKILLTAEEAEYWRGKGRTLHAIEFQFNGRTVRGWSIRHENKPEDIGLYPSVLIDLFNKRAEVKAIMAVPGAIKELIELVYGRAQKAVAAELRSRGKPEKEAEKEAGSRALSSAEVAEAVRRVLADAEAEKARSDAALAPGAPPVRIPPGSTLAEEMADLKRLGKNAKEIIERVNHLYDLAGRTADAPPTDDAVKATVRAEYERACFDWTCANTKQGAIKVYMNTFYGEAGNSLSSFFLLQLAGGVTSAGQYNIKLVADFVTGRGFRVKYGDTDSLYLQPPEAVFAECDHEYAMGRLTREEYWSAMVRITMRALNQIRDEVNDFLRKDNGTKYLKMAYEEVLYPVVFTGKKKYFGIPHLNEVNFRPKKLFIKGIDVVKQGQPGLARDIGNRIMWACMALDNRRSVQQIVEDVLRDAVVNGAQWGFDHFIKTDAWKPNKNNVSVHRFIARMRVQHAAEVAKNERIVAAGGAPKPYLYELPEPGERFSYIIAKTGATFNLRGLKSTMKKGDRMEYAHVAKALGIEIDVALYMVNYVVGLCARFINGEARYQPPAGARISEKEVDKKSQEAAKKYLANYVKGLGNLDSNMMRSRGFAYKRAYKGAAAVVREALVDRVGAGAAEVLHGEWLDFELFDHDEADEDGDDEAAATVVDPTSAAIESIWTNAGILADTVIASDNAAWCRGVALELGIESNGSDSRPTSQPPSRPTSRPPSRPASPEPGPEPAPVSAPAKAPTKAPAKAPASAPASAPAKTPKAPATRLFSAANATRRRPARGYSAAALYSNSLDRQEAAVRTEMAEALPAVSEIAARYEADLSRRVHQLRLEEHAAHAEIGAPEPGRAPPGAAADDVLVGITPADTKTLLDFRRVWYAAVGVQMTRRREAAFTRYIGQLKDRRLGAAPAPGKIDRGHLIAAAAAKMRTSGGLGIAI